VTRTPSLAAMLLGLGLSACFSTDTELITRSQSTRLFGKQFKARMDASEEAGPFLWNEERKEYVDVKGDVAARFARLKGVVYLGQLEMLRDPDPQPSALGVRIEGPTALPGRKGYVIGLVRLIGDRASIVIEPHCENSGIDQESMARGYGVTLESGAYVPVLRGQRAGLLGFVTSVLVCDLDPPAHMNVPIDAPAAAVGGPELAAQAAAYEGELFAEPEKRRCEGGDLRACHHLGVRYLKGDGVTKDALRSRPLLARACDGGRDAACLDLGQIYDRGDGVPRDVARARELYRKACEGGEPFACEELKNR
jgi:hypothetical protein